jgi:hypothetical protein
VQGHSRLANFDPRVWVCRRCCPKSVSEIGAELPLEFEAGAELRVQGLSRPGFPGGSYS